MGALDYLLSERRLVTYICTLNLLHKSLINFLHLMYLLQKEPLSYSGTMLKVVVMHHS